jgi:hypothetical protein
MSRWPTFLVVVSLALAPVTTPFAFAAQSSVSTSDLQRLDDTVARLRADVDALRERDTALARSFERDLNELGEDVTYLRVKLRREGSVPRADYTDVSDRAAALERRVRGDAGRQAEPVEPTRSRREGEAPVGQQMDVRLQSPLSSATAEVEDRFEATSLVDLLEGDRVLIPAGSVLRGVVKSVQRAGRIERRASLTLAFDQITVRGRAYPIRATVTDALAGGGYREDAGKIGTGAAVGAIIGGILGGFKGAMAGVLIGGGGTVVATEGRDLRLEPGAVLRIRFDEPVVID